MAVMERDGSVIKDLSSIPSSHVGSHVTLAFVAPVPSSGLRVPHPHTQHIFTQTCTHE